MKLHPGVLQTVELLEDNCKNFSWIISPGEDWLNQPLLVSGGGVLMLVWDTEKRGNCGSCGNWDVCVCLDTGIMILTETLGADTFLMVKRFTQHLSQPEFCGGLIVRVAVGRRDVYHRKLSVRPRTRVLFVKMICNFAKFIPQLVIRRTFAIQFLPELIPQLAIISPCISSSLKVKVKLSSSFQLNSRV